MVPIGTRNRRRSISDRFPKRTSAAPHSCSLHRLFWCSLAILVFHQPSRVHSYSLSPRISSNASIRKALLSPRRPTTHDVTHTVHPPRCGNALFASFVDSSAKNLPSKSRKRYNFSRLLNHIYLQIIAQSSKIKRILALLFVAASLTLSGPGAHAAGRSGGRAGGSFGRSCRPPMSRPMPSRSMGGGRSWGGGSGSGGFGRGYYGGPMRGYRRSPAIYFFPRPNYGRLDGSAGLVDDPPTTESTQATENNSGNDGPEVVKFSDAVGTMPTTTNPNGMRRNNQGSRVMNPLTYYAILTGVYGAAVYASNKSRDEAGLLGGTNSNASPLGPGISVCSLTVSLDVPNRDDQYNILSRIEDTVSKANTNSRKGVQSLISDVALELLRQEASVTGACSTYAHLKSEGAADRTYYQLSTVERSKFERESVNKFGGKKALEVVDTSSSQDSDDKEVPNAKATSAVVTLLLQIEGDQTKVDALMNRTDLKTALLRISADAQMEDCLLSAEVLWTPSQRGDSSMTKQDVTALYPNLISL